MPFEQVLFTPAQFFEKRFPVQGLDPVGIDVVNPGVEHPPDLGQFFEIAGHYVLNQLFFRSARLGREPVQFGRKLRRKMNFHRV